MVLTDFYELLIDKEIQSSTGANVCRTVLGRPNILVGDLNLAGGKVWDAIEFVPPGCAGEAIINDFLQWDQCKPTHEVKLLWNVNGCTPKGDQFYWCMSVRSNDMDSDMDYEIDRETAVIPIHASKDDHVHMLSFFGGGFGGWTYGMKHLCAYHGISAQIVAIESDLTACTNYAANHDVPIVNGYDDLPANLMTRMPKGCVIHGNVLATTWMNSMAEWHPDILTISAPCQPWSGAGHAKGLATPDGLAFPEALLQARLLQPEVIGLEQVTGFNTHEQRATVIKVISMIGYAINWSRSFDYAVCGPVTRSRWIALLNKICDIPPVDWCPRSLKPFSNHDGCEGFDKQEVGDGDGFDMRFHGNPSKVADRFSNIEVSLELGRSSVTQPQESDKPCFRCDGHAESATCPQSPCNPSVKSQVSESDADLSCPVRPDHMQPVEPQPFLHPCMTPNATTEVSAKYPSFEEKGSHQVCSMQWCSQYTTTTAECLNVQTADALSTRPQPFVHPSIHATTVGSANHPSLAEKGPHQVCSMQWCSQHTTQTAEGPNVQTADAFLTKPQPFVHPAIHASDRHARILQHASTDEKQPIMMPTHKPAIDAIFHAHGSSF